MQLPNDFEVTSHQRGPANGRPARCLLFSYQYQQPILRSLSMARRKHTTVYKGLFGEKHIVTKYDPDGGGCLMWIVVGIIAFALLRGCS